uniref:Uncharacterized protein n=1 Tax=Knipowitschia caucasica TaxID=637954 RepID=A0AAV2JIX1_KNICA
MAKVRLSQKEKNKLLKHLAKECAGVGPSSHSHTRTRTASSDPHTATETQQRGHAAVVGGRRRRRARVESKGTALCGAPTPLSSTMLYFQMVIMAGTIMLAYYFEYTDTFSVHVQGFFCYDSAYTKPYLGPEDSSAVPPVLLYALVAGLPTLLDSPQSARSTGCRVTACEGWPS